MGNQTPKIRLPELPIFKKYSLALRQEFASSRELLLALERTASKIQKVLDREEQKAHVASDGFAPEDEERSEKEPAPEEAVTENSDPEDPVADEDVPEDLIAEDVVSEDTDTVRSTIEDLIAEDDAQEVHSVEEPDPGSLVSWAGDLDEKGPSPKRKARTKRKRGGHSSAKKPAPKRRPAGRGAASRKKVEIVRVSRHGKPIAQTSRARPTGPTGPSGGKK